ncbi:hypothetical protein L6164_016114 [Bauhinia variegata]|uniref:Uncharacterized protein n=1 Tax=Bauhinia variegata TaxID=167791 RepID=A0ACB9NP07_BAUVA|nr:hypothetical protein L6164_016114 [Bauhinia variegata]
MLTFSSESPPSPPNGDYIGTESCIDLQNDNKSAFDASTGTSISSDDGKRGEAKSRNSRINKKEKKEFPPPISLLARTQNLHPHMPWILRRYYTNDGRLILKEEKVRHHEYFRARRANGRLTLQLVPLDDDVFDTLPSCLDNHDLLQQEITRPSETNLGDRDSFNSTSFVDEQVQHKNVDDGSDSDTENKRAPVAANSTAPNPLNCSRVTSDSSCIFGVPVHAIS